MTEKIEDNKNNDLQDFLSPQSMLTPGFAGALTMMISNTVYFQFGIDRALVGLTISILFASLVSGLASIPNWQKVIYCILNSLVIFSVALGTNTVGEYKTDRNMTTFPDELVFSDIISPSQIFFIKSAHATITNGSLVHGSGPTVYFIIDNKRKPIPNPTTFEKLGFNWNAIRKVSDQELDSFPIGLAYPSISSRLVRSNLNPHVYLLKQGRRHHIPDPRTFEVMGFKWGNISVMQDSAINSIPLGDPLPKRIRPIRPFFGRWL